MSIESNLRFLVDYRWGGDLVTMHKDEACALLAVVDEAREVMRVLYEDCREEINFGPLHAALAELEAEA